MKLKALLPISKYCFFLLGFLTFVVTLSCATHISESSSPPSEEPLVVIREAEGSATGETSPQALASLSLTEHARSLLKSNRTDEAISTLERAINLNPTNGQNYFYLSEAWLIKGRISQAKEFNRLAGIYLKEDSNWMVRVREQRRRIDEHHK